MNLNIKAFFFILIKFSVGCATGIIFVLVKTLYWGSLESLTNISLMQVIPLMIFIVFCGIFSAIWGIDVIKALFKALESK